MIGLLAVFSLVVAAIAQNPVRPLGQGIRAAVRARAGARAGGALDVAQNVLSMRSDVNQIRLDKLFASLEKAEAEFKAIDVDDHHEVDHLEGRLEKITGNGCDKREFQCGGVAPQCVSNLVVCDGSSDCNNGHDEDADVCVNLVTEGSSWTWEADWGTCIASEAHHGKMLITSAIRSKFFPAWVQLAMTITTDDGDDHDHNFDPAITTGGIWTFAGRKFIINPGTPGFPATVCRFEKGNDDHCEGELVRADTWETCGHISATRHN